MAAMTHAKMETTGKNNQKFSDKYTAKWPCIVPSRKGVHYALCTVCHCGISVRHGGQYDVKIHVASPKHRDILKVTTSTHSLQNFFIRERSTDNSIIKAVSDGKFFGRT